MLVHLENKNPTEAERRLFLWCGYYVVDKKTCNVCGEEKLDYIRYAVCRPAENLRKTFPVTLDVEQSVIDYKDTFWLHNIDEMIEIKGSLFTAETLSLIIQRIEELGWENLAGTITTEK